MDALAQHGLQLQYILLTHGHIDHVGAAKALATECDVQIIGPHIDDKFWLENLPRQSQNFGFPACEAFEADRYLEDGEEVTLGEQVLQVFHCPGHTPGHVIFFDREENLAWVGDVLFRGSIGRTDFPGSNYQQLIDSIRYKLWPLGEQVNFIPGHGPMSSFGEERRNNPFVADQLLAD
ncbi:MAG: MBL fold metallo-hydrolase [Shewanella algae]